MQELWAMSSAQREVKTDKRIYGAMLDGFVNTYRQLMFINQQLVSLLSNLTIHWLLDFSILFNFHTFLISSSFSFFWAMLVNSFIIYGVLDVLDRCWYLNTTKNAPSVASYLSIARMNQKKKNNDSKWNWLLIMKLFPAW